jgi:hypothetical protein
MKKQHVKDAIDRVVEALRTGDIKRIAYAVFKSQRDRPSDSWSFFNRLTMFASGTEDARGFRQWQRTGRHLLKGTKALYILGPVKYKTRIKVTNGDGEEVVQYIVEKAQIEEGGASSSIDFLGKGNARECKTFYPLSNLEPFLYSLTRCTRPTSNVRFFMYPPP